MSLEKLARLQLIRARHRLLQRARGVEVRLRTDEAAAIRGQVLSGCPMDEVAARFGVTLERVRRAAREAWPELLDRVPGALGRTLHERQCQACGATYTVQYAASPQRYCSRQCGSGGAQRLRAQCVAGAHQAETSQEPRGGDVTIAGLLAAFRAKKAAPGSDQAG